MKIIRAVKETWNSLKKTFADFLKEKKEKKLFRFSVVFFRILLLFLLVYLFLLSITLMGSAFKFFGKDFANRLIATTSNPLVGLVIGILATSIIQSSSTTTSIVVGLVGAGALSISNAIPIIMGANVGTSVTNLLVSLGHISQKAEFRRAFGAAVVHDIFNLIAVLVLFPIQNFPTYWGFSPSFLQIRSSIWGGLQQSAP